jgi:hypothetical protein
MVSEIEYQELIERNINPQSLKHFILDLEEVYKRENGWNVGNIEVVKAPNDQIKVSVTVTKQPISDDINTYTTHIAIVKKDNLNNEIQDICNKYTKEEGYTIGNPLTNTLNDNEIIIRIPLTKQSNNLKL